jgi:hypothetical protein
LEKEVMFDGEGNIVSNINVGRPSKYQITNRENIIFVDETGCNTNMKRDRLVGGEMFILPQDPSAEFGLTGLASDIHFTVLCFLNALSISILCAVILK